MSHLPALVFLNLEVCSKLHFSGGGNCIFESEVKINMVMTSLDFDHSFH